MFYNGVFGCHGNTCYVILIGAFFNDIGPINVCTDFGTKLTNLENCKIVCLVDVT